MSGSGRKDFDVKHILRLRWKLFSHPSPAPGGPAGGGCLQQDGSGSFEHWGPSQSRLLKSQEKGSVSTFWKKTSSSSSSSSSSPPSSSSSFNPLNGTLLPVATRLQQGAPGQGTQQPARTLFYVESLEEEEVPGMDFPGPHDKGLVLQELKVEPANSSQATVSDYFAAMFTSDVCEAKQEEIKMEGIDPNALWDLVQFAYTGCLELKEDTIENLLAAACLLQLPQVVEVCCHFLMKLLHPSNCLGIRAFADAQGCIELMKVAHSYTMENIMEVMRNQEFLLLPAEELHKLLASDDVNVPDEETIFHALMMWVKYDMQRRCNDLSMLLAFIRLPLLPPQTFHKNSDCILSFILRIGVTVLEGPIYAVGGHDGWSYLNTVERWDPQSQQWTFVASMSIARSTVGVAALNGKCTAFLNVTMAPNSSQGLIVVNQDSVTKTIISESVMEPQALNEINDEEEGTVNSQSEESENELDSSKLSNRNADMFLHELKEDNSELINKLWTDIQQKIATQNSIICPLHQGNKKLALNATNAVRRIHTRLQSEESTETLDSGYLVGQVLSSRKQKQLLNKVKGKPDLHALSKHNRTTLAASTASTDLPNSKNPGWMPSNP
ncbi:hypothetical protein GH733_006591 [Mirounga leonina]|nr:hypothetical protein GH733_006591 [Mirounga leonina]